MNVMPMPFRSPIIRLGALALCWYSAAGYYDHGSFMQSGFLRRGPLCRLSDEIAFAVMTNKTSKLNLILKGNDTSHQRVGCWNMRAYNTDKFMTSAVYQHDDGRCALALSGYHASVTGLPRAMASLMWPPKVVSMCGNKLYAPFVRLLRHHTSLANWSKLVDFFAGQNSSCEGELTVAAASVGGSMAEILAACANVGNLSTLQNETVPQFQLQTLYTFGSIAASTKPLTNPLRPDGCFKGKRVFFSEDAVSRLGGPVGLKHARMDALELWDNDQPAVQAYGCLTSEAVSDDTHDKPRQYFKQVLRPKKRGDLIQSSMDDYESNMKWIHRVGLDDLLHKEPTPDEESNEPGAAEERQRLVSTNPDDVEEDGKAQLTTNASASTEGEEEFFSKDEEEESEPAVAAYAAFFTKHAY